METLEHVASYSFDPAALPGNIEHFTGVAQVPIGVAGPLLVDGEHAQGEFYVPLATAEGTLVTVAIRDTTERKQMEERMQQANRTRAHSN